MSDGFDTGPAGGAGRGAGDAASPGAPDRLAEPDAGLAGLRAQGGRDGGGPAPSRPVRAGAQSRQPRSAGAGARPAVLTARPRARHAGAAQGARGALCRGHRGSHRGRHLGQGRRQGADPRGRHARGLDRRRLRPGRRAPSGLAHARRRRGAADPRGAQGLGSTLRDWHPAVLPTESSIMSATAHPAARSTCSSSRSCPRRAWSSSARSPWLVP